MTRCNGLKRPFDTELEHSNPASGGLNEDGNRSLYRTTILGRNAGRTVQCKPCTANSFADSTNSNSNPANRNSDAANVQPEHHNSQHNESEHDESEHADAFDGLSVTDTQHHDKPERGNDHDAEQHHEPKRHDAHCTAGDIAFVWNEHDDGALHYFPEHHDSAATAVVFRLGDPCPV